MKLIAAADRNWAIGNKGKLLVSIPEDMKYFRNTTLDNVVVMGRKTLESFPGKRPLERRLNIVLTTDKNYQVGDVIVDSIPDLLAELQKYNQDEIFVIGGETVYRQLLPYCDEAYVTRIDFAYEADAFFPNLDEEPGWEFVGESEEQTYFDLIYCFSRYKNTNVKDIKEVVS